MTKFGTPGAGFLIARGDMKKLLFLLIFLISTNAYAYKDTYNPFTGKLDKVGADEAGDISASLCSDGQILKKSGGVWACGSDDSTAGGGTVRVSEDGTFIASADTLNFTTGVKATVATGSKLNVSSDIATTTTPGIASFDSSQFSVRSFGGVSVTGINKSLISHNLAASVDVLVSASHDAVTVTGENYASLSGQQITFGTVNDTNLTAEDFGDFTCDSGEDGCLVDANSVALGTDTTGNYVATIADSGASEVTVANSGTETAAVTLALASGITRDTEWDTEGEVQTAWGSVDILLKTEADGYYQPLESTLTDIADGTIAENLVNTANPWADNEVADDLTASNYLPLAGGTMTGELKIDENGIEGQPTDALTDCSTFAATGGGIFYDDSEGQWKKCEDNVLSDLDTGGGGGDSVSIDGAGVTDPDFVSTGQIDFVDTSNTVTANINDNSILEADLKAVDSSSDEDVLTYESTTGDFEWHSRDEIVGGISAGALPNDSIVEADLKAVDSASDEECLTYETTTGDFEWQACGSGSDTNAVKEYWWPASATLPLEAADSIPPISKDAGTNVDQLAVLFDSATDECRSVTFKVPSDVASGSTITFRALWYSTATSGDVMWDFRHTSGDTEGESWDDSLTTEVAAADTVQGTTKLITVTTWTETLTNLGWAANDLVTGVFCRDANNGSDTMSADAYAIGFGVEIPRA